MMEIRDVTSFFMSFGGATNATGQEFLAKNEPMESASSGTT
jgi:hypothetical protein